MSREAMKLALEALENITRHFTRSPSTLKDSEVRGDAHKAIKALEALAKPDFWEGYVPEPVKPAQLPFGVGGGLVAIKTLLSRDPCVHANTAIQMIDAILAKQPAQQEPVAYLCENAVGHQYFRWKKPSSTYKPIALYTSPPAQRTWVGLSDLDMDELENEYMKSAQTAHEFLRAIEAALRSKNT